MHIEMIAMLSRLIFSCLLRHIIELYYILPFRYMRLFIGNFFCLAFLYCLVLALVMFKLFPFKILTLNDFTYSKLLLCHITWRKTSRFENSRWSKIGCFHHLDFCWAFTETSLWLNTGVCWPL